MKPLKEFPLNKRSGIKYLLTDIDDTLTCDGRIPACAFKAMEDLYYSGINVIPITGRPAGWCDHIARMWPVNGVVGENGAFYFVYDTNKKKMRRRYFKSDDERKKDQLKLDKIKQKILKSIPKSAVSVDQPYREADLAIDFAEDVPRLSYADIEKIVEIFEVSGACAKISSIHVNGWFGDYDKLSMTKILFNEIFKTNLDMIKEGVIYIGDSPNDEPMFEYFPNAVGVANIQQFKKQLVHKPAWVTNEQGGIGFAELTKILIKDNQK